MSTICLGINPLHVTIEMKAIEQYFHVVLFIMQQGGSNFSVCK